MLLPEKRTRVYYTTARVIHTPPAEDWLWINPSQSWWFETEESAQSHANLANDNAQESGLNVTEYPYFVVKVTQTSTVEKVES